MIKRFNQGLEVKEEQELNQWLEQSEENRRFFDRFTHSDYIAEGLQVLQRIDKEAEWKKIIQKIGKEKPVKISAAARIPWQRYMAAAIVCALVSMGAWFWTRYQSRSNPPAAIAKTTTPNKDIAPGGNKATLTLSDGSSIVLDEAGKGTIARQGSADVQKLDNGRLSYTLLNEKPGATEKAGATVYNTLTTPRAGQYQLTLPDGSKVWLNNASSLRYPTAFPGETREVELSGEAYFEVARNVTQPFKVKVNGKMDVDVLGTSFNIMAYTDESQVRTTLLTGAVRVSEGSKDALLKPGQQARLSAAGQMKVTDDVDIDRVVAWKNGFFYFDRADVPAVMRQLARWYDLEIKYEGQVPLHEFGGKMGRNLNLSEALEVLKNNDIHCKVEGRTLTVLP